MYLQKTQKKLHSVVMIQLSLIQSVVIRKSITLFKLFAIHTGL